MQINGGAVQSTIIRQSERGAYRNWDFDTGFGYTYFAGGDIGPIAGQYPSVQVWNPAGSGWVILLDAFHIAALVATEIYFYTSAVQLTTVLDATVKKRYNGVPAVGQLRGWTNAANPIPPYSRIQVNASRPILYTLNRPVILEEGEGFSVSGSGVNTVLNAGFEWREL